MYYERLAESLKTPVAENKAREMLIKRLAILKEIAVKGDDMPFDDFGRGIPHVNLMYYTAWTCIELEDYSEYIDFYRQYIGRHIRISYTPHNIETPIIFLAKCYQKMSGVKKTIEALKAEAERLKDNKKVSYLIHKTLGWLYTRGSVCEETNAEFTNTDEAIKEYERAIELMLEMLPITASNYLEADSLSSQKGHLLAELIDLYKQSNNWLMVKQTAEKGIIHATRDPRNFKDDGWNFYMSKALACKNLGEYNEAIETHKWLVKAERTDEYLLENLRQSAKMMGRTQEIEEFLSQHIQTKEIPTITMKSKDYRFSEECKDYSHLLINAIVSDGNQIFCGGGNWNRWRESGIGEYAPSFFLLFYDKKKERWLLPSPIEEYPKHNVTALALDGEYVWCATAGSGVLRYSPKENKWERFTTKNGLFDNEIYSIAVDREYVWFGGGDLQVEQSPDPMDTSSRSEYGIYASGKGGVGCYDKKTGKWSVYVEAVEKPYAVTAVVVDSNLLWVGTAHGSVSSMDKKTGEWRNLLQGGKYTISAIAVDDESVWIGTRWKGLLKYDKTKESFAEYSEVKVKGIKETQGRAKLETINVLAVDKKFLYVGEFRGLLLYSKDNDIWMTPEYGSIPITSMDIDRDSIWCDGVHFGRLREYKKAEVFNMLP